MRTTNPNLTPNASVANFRASSFTQSPYDGNNLPRFGNDEVYTGRGSDALHGADGLDYLNGGPSKVTFEGGYDGDCFYTVDAAPGAIAEAGMTDAAAQGGISGTSIRATGLGWSNRNEGVCTATGFA